jgi:hypothetical protein
MRLKTLVPALALLASTVACYHATIETGATPSTQVIDKPFASGWIYGLIPPSTVSTAAKCPNGVAKVETQLSFVNQLVTFITGGIYTPMSIRVTCATGKVASAAAPHADVSVNVSAGDDSVRAAFAKAADQAVRANRPVLVDVQE